MLSGQRLNQIANLQTAWIDYQQETICFPSWIMKNGVEHVLPLTPLTLHHLNLALTPHTTPQNALDKTATATQETHYIPSYNSPSPNTTTYIWGDKPFTHPQNAMKLFKEALPQIKDWRLHDFRRKVSSTMAKIGVKLEVVERLLAHRSGKVSGIAAVYNRHEYVDEMRDALLAYEQYLRVHVKLDI
jgi:integrase